MSNLISSKAINAVLTHANGDMKKISIEGFSLYEKKIGTITLYSGKSYFKINFSGKNYRVGHNLLFECKENLRNNYF